MRQVKQISASLQKSKSKRKLKIKNYQSINDELMIGQGKIKYGKALIFGSPSVDSGTKMGNLVCSSRNGRPTLVNLPGYRFGMSQIIKVPQSGREIKLYHEKERKNYSFVLFSKKPEFDLEELRGRWVVARLNGTVNTKGRLRLLAFQMIFGNREEISEY